MDLFRPSARGAGAALFALMTASLLLGGGERAVTAQGTPPRFLRDVAPILDKQGCSTAGCHGKFGGRGGFQISLLTLSPEDDYDPLVRGARGRRVNLVEPEKSLLLLKATGKIPHGGGERFAVGSREWRVIRDWIAAGAPFDPESEPKLASLTVTPGEAVLPKVGGTRRLKVVARFTDGVTQDVTPYASYETSDPAVLEVDGRGVVTGKRWGGAAVIVRYLGAVRSASLALPRADRTPYPKVTASNFVDTHVQANLRRMNVAPSRLTTDREFVRRLYLDVCGRLPTPAEADAFVADRAPDKRARLIDRLLDSPEYADVRTLRLCDLLRVNPRLFGGGVGERAAVRFTDWVRDAVAADMPWDRFVRELILARGSNLHDPTAAFYLVDGTPQDRMETVGQAFLGQRMSCARCHKHPFDRWNTDDYWNFAALWAGISVRPGEIDGERQVFFNPAARVVNQSVTGKARGKPAEPTLLGDARPLAERLQEDAGTAAMASLAAVGRTRGPVAPTDPDAVNDGIDTRGATPVGEAALLRLAEWATGPKNPYFARATVNRLWGNYLGRGIVHPVDDMRETSPPSVPGLLDALADDFVRHGYDVKHTIRTILNSRTYQTASDPTPGNALDDKFFSRFYPRPMLGQVFLDVLNQATGSTERFGDFPAPTRAAQLSLPVGSYFLDTFGRAHREFLAELEPKVEPTLVQTLHILNSPYIDSKVKGGEGTVAALLKQKVGDAGLVKALYAQTFCRPPSPKELAAALAYLKASPKRDEAAHDLMWALISAREFYFVS